MKSFLFLCSVLLFPCYLAQKVPEISFISSNVIADIGGKAEITCTVLNGQDYSILWERISVNGDANGNIPISSGKKLLLNHDKRFKLHVDEDTGSYTLKINNVMATDGAEYQCKVIYALDNIIKANVALQIRLPPTIVDEETTTHYNASVGDDISMTCVADGFPKPRIIWSRKDGKLLPRGREEVIVPVFTISDVKREDDGDYLCVANNDVGSPESRVITLHVKYAPKVFAPKPKIAQAQGYEVELACEIEAYPPASIHWKKDNLPVKEGDGIVVTHWATENDITKSVVKISNVAESDYGYFKCEAANVFGNDSQWIELYESNLPVCPPLCSEEGLFDESSANNFVQQSAILIFVTAIFTHIFA